MSFTKSLVATLSFVLSTGAMAGSEFDLMRERYLADLVLLDAKQMEDSIRDQLATLREDGTWPEIDYTAVDSMDFKPIQGIGRAADFSKAYATPGHRYYQSPDARAAAVKVARHWLENDFQSYNWWNNQIGIPLKLLPIALRFLPDFSPSEVQRLKTILARAKYVRPDGRTHTGQNTLWIADILFARGVLFHDLKDVASGLAGIKSEIKVGQGEGIQVDGSFFQHGSLIYNGGYGQKFGWNLAKYVYFTSGTSQAFTPREMAVVDDFLLEGTRLMLRGKTYDIGVTGREFVRPYGASTLAQISARFMSESSSPRKMEYQAWHREMESGAPGMTVNKMFHRADMMVHHRPEFYASSRMCSVRTFNTDAPSNGEGLMSHNIADGAMFVMRTGNEYAGIFPVWRWEMIPGTTAVNSSPVPARFVPGVESGENMRSKGKSTFVGGVSDGLYGASGISFMKANVSYDLRAKKSWFFHDRSVIALGTDIRCSDCRAPVLTTLQQSNAVGVLGTVGQGIWHDGTAYLPLDDSKIEATIALQTGSWYSINQQASKDLVTRPVFTAWIDHGTRPSGAGYAYAVVPGVTAEEARRISFSSSELAWKADSQVHAVWMPRLNLLQAVFFSAGSVSLGGQALTVDQPAIVQLRTKGSGEARLSIADPQQRHGQISVSWNGGAPKVIQLPQGAMAGASKTVTF